MLQFLIRRFLQLIPTFVLATVFVYVIIQAAPGDFLTQFRENPSVTPQALEALKAKFGLDKSYLEQFWLWFTNFLRGDFGISFSHSSRPVWDLVAPRMWNSMILVIFSLLLSYAIAIPVAIYSATRPYSFLDRFFSIFSYFGLGIPSFFFSLLAIYVLLITQQNFGWDMPISGKSSSNLVDPTPARYAWDVFIHSLVPSIILALRSISSESRVLRAQLMEVLGQDYMRTARAKGLAYQKIMYKHAFRNAILPIVAGLGGLLPAFLSGAGFVEVVFAWPGLTPLLLEAVQTQDLYVLMSTTALTTILYIVGNMLSDILLAAVDPRIRYN
ncbi:ABC transporter permease [Deinococcus cellulosilyticus]|uniref:Peptide ABC transporter permease n=1 Tax=Deinococcus cellulosilyticus (strain DSM 18568 / NBRC 106333 / KACC 11606 / 5516J-15) TaxID=1223518 RepID=A0A511NBK2_DEIC1|nr:ABC transporter permease [Deinococcus cellulosilyticus]GEM49946.1 peptide ABC transporter permease [Deinococcus cellulosilyticus NBRC 106333 = KACC 11606]